MGTLPRYLAAAAAIVCVVVTTASTGLASDTSAKHATRTYATRGTPPLATALVDPWLFNSRQTPKAFALTRAAGATHVRLAVNWNNIAPSVRPDGFVATDPTSPGYNWTNADAAIRGAEEAGLTPILDVASTPHWAYAKRPQGVNAGTPKAAMLGQFAKALALHYDGKHDAPAEHIYQVWNEPNVSLYLSPVKASTYRSMVNEFADGVHSVSPKNIVIAGDLDPFGHPKSKKQEWNSVAPLTFMRSLLSSKIHFDVWSHHPYTFGGAFGKARNPNDVELGDLPRMRAVLQAGRRLHHVVSSHPVKFWVTEFSWATKPPRRHAAPMALAARWTAESLYQMFRSGVSLVTWFGLQDRGGSGPYQSGLYRHSRSLDAARAKPVRTAFRFPFVAYLGRGSVSVWGRDATSNKRVVAIQVRHGSHGHWRTVAKVGANRYGIFKAKLRLRATSNDWLRASAAGSGTSLGFSLKVPFAPHIGPWGN